jgi:hypothetical protein
MKSTLKYGLITGTISVIWLFGGFTLFTWMNGKFGWGLQADTVRGIGGLISIPIQAIGIYLAMQNVKQVTGGLSYGQAVKTGLTVAVTIAVMISIFGLIYCTMLNPNYAEFMAHDAQKFMIARGETQQQINKELAGVRMEYSTGGLLIESLVGQFGTGAIISLIIGIFIKTKK